MTLFNRCINNAIIALQTLRGQVVTDREIAETFGTTPSSLSRWRNGVTNPEPAETLLRLLLSLPGEIVKEIFNNLRTEMESKYPKEQKNNHETPKFIQIGNLKLTLKDLWGGLGVLGPIETEKTSAILKPALQQLLTFCNEADGEYAKIGGIVYDSKDEYLPEIIETFTEIGRPLSDIILISPESSAFRYNPIGKNRSARDTAKKLSEMQRSLPGYGSPESAWWEDTCQRLFSDFLHLLEIAEPNQQIGMDTLARHIRNDELAEELCNKVRGFLKEKEGQITESTYEETVDAIKGIQQGWLELSKCPRALIEAMAANLLEPFKKTPELQKIFCQDTNFDLKDIINNGKLVVIRKFNSDPIAKAIAGLIADFRSLAECRCIDKYELNSTRSLLLFGDEYQEIASYRDNKDKTCSKGKAPTKFIQIIAAQSLASLKAEDCTEKGTTFAQNIENWIFLKNTDLETNEYCKSLTGSDTLECQIATEESKKGPWYTEGIFHTKDLEKAARTPAKATRIQFALKPIDRTHAEQIENEATLFLSTLISNEISQRPMVVERDLLAEEAALIRVLEQVRNTITKRFPEIANPTEIRSPLGYRMLEDIQKETLPEGKMTRHFQPSQTLEWAIRSQSPSVYTAIRRELIEGGNSLPTDLTIRLASLENSQLHITFTTILSACIQDK